MAKRAFSAVFGLALAACSSPQEVSDDVGLASQSVGAAIAAPQQPEPPAPPAPPPEAANQAVSFIDNEEENGGTREFSVAWPNQVAAIPALEKILKTQRDSELAQQKRSWAEAVADCPEEFVSCRSNAFNLEWQVVADLTRFLSLSNSLYTYGGGAHGNYARGALVWDRDKGEAINPKAMFTSLGVLGDAIGGRACALLNAEREERRGEPISPGGWPDHCVSMDETVLFLGSSDGQSFDRLGVYYAPYVAGPYAEGDFEFTLPVTQSVIEAVRPEYRDRKSVV